MLALGRRVRDDHYPMIGAVQNARLRRAILAMAAVSSVLTLAGQSGQGQSISFTLSYAAGGRDEAGRFAGGTEMRFLTSYEGRLYAGSGYWKDRPGPEGQQGAQILVLNAPGDRWRVDHSFDERLPNGRLRDLAVGALAPITFTTNAAGRTLSRPVSLLLASTWDLTGAARVFTRDSAGRWTGITLAEDRPGPDFLPQIRSFGSHRDRVTGVDTVFAGEMPRGIFAGTYDPTAPGQIRWATDPELRAAAISATFSGLEGRLRVSSFAEANNRLYAAVGQQIYERIDGASPQWRLIYTNPQPGHSETGLRGLTTIRASNGQQSLLAAVEGDAARIVRIDPQTGTDVTELDLPSFLSKSWGMRAAYSIAAYNDMSSVSVSGVGDVLIVGLMAFVPRGVPAAYGHTLVDVGYGQVEGGAWYLVRWPDGRYELHQVNAPFPQSPVAVRSIRVSPFAGDENTLYFGGFDANKASAHNTAWIARAKLTTVLNAPP